jgi:WD40 repeat protein
LHPDGQLLAVGSGNGYLQILNPTTLEPLQSIEKAHDNTVFSLAFSPDGKYLVSGGRDAKMKVFAQTSHGLWQQVLDIPAHMYTVNQLSFSPDGRWLASVSRDRTVKIWEAATFRLCKVLDTLRDGCHINSVNAVAWLSDSCFVTCSDDRTLIVWEVSESL